MPEYLAKFAVTEPSASMFAFDEAVPETSIYTRVITAKNEAEAERKAREVRRELADSFTNSVVFKSLELAVEE